MPIVIRDIPFIGKPKRPAAAATPAALTLVSAAFDDGALTLTLTFDRAIDIAGIDVSAFWVDDGVVGFRYQGWDTASLDGPATVLVQMNGIDDSTVPDVVMNVSAGSGIVAADDGASWAGATDLPLPFP
jgi:hypothetical protein